MTFEMYDPQFLAGVVEQLYDQPSFLRDKFFTNKKTFITPEVLIDVYKGTRKMTPFVHPNASAPLTQRNGYHTERYVPAAVKEKRAVDVWQLQQRLAGEIVMNSGKTPAERAVLQLARDIQEMKNNLQRREEWMAAQVMFTGKVEVKGEGVDDVIDFGFDGKESLAGEKRWGQSKADVFGDILTWQTKVQKKSGYRPNTLIASAETIDRILRDENALKLFDNNGLNFGDNAYTDLGQGAAHCGRLAGQINVNLYSYDNYYEDPVTDEVKPFVPANTICLCNPFAQFSRLYGAMTYIERGDGDDIGKFKTVEGEYLTDSFSTKDPDAQFVTIESRPLFVPTQVDSYVIATVG